MLGTLKDRFEIYLIDRPTPHEGFLRGRRPREMSIDVRYEADHVWVPVAAFKLYFWHPPLSAPQRMPTLPFQYRLIDDLDRSNEPVFRQDRAWPRPTSWPR